MRRLLRWAFNLAASLSAVLFVATCVLWVGAYRGGVRPVRFDWRGERRQVELSGGQLRLSHDPERQRYVERDWLLPLFGDEGLRQMPRTEEEKEKEEEALKAAERKRAAYFAANTPPALFERVVPCTTVAAGAGVLPAFRLVLSILRLSASHSRRAHRRAGH